MLEESTADDVISVEELVVTGYRASLLHSLERKRAAVGIIDVISAEDVGKFPDSNVAESLSHLPGISVDRQFGEGEKVSILGTDPALNRVLLNGQTIATGDWGGNPTDTSGRTFNTSLLSPEIISVAEVYKSSEARLPEGSIGGTVFVHTRRPFDLPANTFRASAAYSYNDRSAIGNARGSALYSWKSSNNKLGALLALTHDRDDLHRAGIEYWGFATSSAAGGAIVPFGINAAFFKQVRERDGGQAALQWKPNDQLELNLTLLGVRGDYDNFSQSRYVVPPAWGTLDSYELKNGYVVAGHVSNVNSAGEPANTLQFDTFYRETEVGTAAIDLRADWRSSDDSWAVSSNIGRTKAYGGRDPEYLVSFHYSGGYSFAYDGQRASLTLDDPTAATDPTTLVRPAAAVGGSLWFVNSDDAEDYAQVDVSREISWRGVHRLRFGAKYSQHENSVDSWSYWAGAPETITLADFKPRLIPNNLFDGLPVGGDITKWVTVPKEEIVDYLTARPFVATVDEPGHDFHVRENITAAYTQADFSGAGYRGNVGVRFISTTDLSRYWEFDSEASTYASVTKRRTHDRLLPSANVVWSLSENRVLRLGAARVIARPRYNQLAGHFSRNHQNLTGSGGNPDLEPYESTNLNVSLEWYLGPTAVIAAEVFLRDLSNYILEVTEDKVLSNPHTGENATYAVTSPFNAGDARVRGGSIALQTEIGAGFGIQANYTYSEADTTSGYTMPYLSKHTYNIIPYFARGRWSARLSYNWRSEFFTSIGRLHLPLFADTYKQLDASVTCRINDRVQLTADVTNLLDSTYYWYYRDKYAPMGVYKNGRVLTLGMSVAF